MKLSKTFTFLILNLLISTAVAKNINTATQIFNPSFATLKIQQADNFYAPPIININNGEQIVVSFDEISDDVSYLQYHLIHCNSDWQPSQLIDSEFVDGFNIANIEDYAFSSNTFIHYVNYRIVIPNQDIKPIVSGNYLLQVFPENEPENVILQARFSIDEAQITISGDITTQTDKGFNDHWQQLDFSIDTKLYKVNDPYLDLITIIEQNGRTDNAVTITHPQRVSGTKIFYEHNPNLIFPAANEFRRFETVRANYPGMGIDSTRYINDRYHAFMRINEERASSQYLYDQTQYGRFMIDEYNSTDPDLGADYIDTHFYLDFPQLINADIYVDGEFTNHQYSEDNRMIYNPKTNLYELTMTLKQGSYNYQFLTIPHNGRIGEVSLIEGNHYETVNEYVIKVYHRSPGSRADKLIGYYVVYSGK